MRVKRSVREKLSPQHQAEIVMQNGMFEPPNKKPPNANKASDLTYPELSDIHVILDKARREGYVR